MATAIARPGRATGALGRRSAVTTLALGLVAGSGSARAQSPGPYRVRLDQPRQAIRGLGVELQCDSIGSGNNGLPLSTVSVPHDLMPSERLRFARDLLGRGHGFRYLRLAGGLYYRGMTPDRLQLRERWPEQLQELAQLIRESGMEGVNFEYWSPPSGWKSTNSLLGGTLSQSDPEFLDKFAAAVTSDVAYLNANGVPVVAFGLQNEPFLANLPYSACTYTEQSYVATFNAVGAKLRAAFPALHIHANSWDGQARQYLRNNLDPRLFDAWSWHRVGEDSNDQINNAVRYNVNRNGKEVYSTEFEYLDRTTSEAKMVNTAQSIMNWFTFVDSPTWYWLHALKPTYNVEAPGYALGYWRPQDDNDFSRHPTIAKGCFGYELRNWRALVGFLEWMPWESRRYVVDEPVVLGDQRILAFRQGGPAGKLVLVLTNRGAAPFTFDLVPGIGGAFSGYRYTAAADGWKKPVGQRSGPSFQVTVPVNAIEFWVQT